MVYLHSTPLHLPDALRHLLPERSIPCLLNKAPSGGLYTPAERRVRQAVSKEVPWTAIIYTITKQELNLSFLVTHSARTIAETCTIAHC